MAGSVLALAVLVVLPLTFLVWGSVNTDGHLTLAHFRDAVSSRLYTQALRNSLILGISTAVLSVAVGLPLAWAVGRTNVPGKQQRVQLESSVRAYELRRGPWRSRRRGRSRSWKRIARG